MRASLPTALAVILATGCSAKQPARTAADAGLVSATARRPDAGARGFPKPGAGQSALLARFDLGGPQSFAPAFLRGVRFGMNKKELLRARPKARLRPRRAGAFSLSQPSFEQAEERPEGSGPVQRVEYRLRWGRLGELRIRTRFTKAWPALVAKAIAKWGKPHKSRRHFWTWRHREGLVMLRAPVRDAFVTLRLRRRLGRRGLIAKFGGNLWGAELKIRRIGASRFDIKRASFRKLFANSVAVQRLLRVVPHYRAGKPEGIKLFAIRPRSLFARLGLRNGDVVTHLAGKPTKDPRVVLETFHRLRRLRAFDARIERRGRPLLLEYRVVP